MIHLKGSLSSLLKRTPIVKVSIGVALIIRFHRLASMPSFDKPLGIDVTEHISVWFI